MALSVASSLDDIIAYLDQTFPPYPIRISPDASPGQVHAAYWMWRGREEVISHLRSLAEDPDQE